MQILPETLLHSLSYLSVQELAEKERVCKKWKSVIHSPNLWSSISLKVTPESPPIVSTLTYLSERSNSRLKEISIDIPTDIAREFHLVPILQASASSITSLEIMKQSLYFPENPTLTFARESCPNIKHLSTIKVNCPSKEIPQNNDWLRQFQSRRAVQSSTPPSSSSSLLQSLDIQGNQLRRFSNDEFPNNHNITRDGFDWLLGSPLESLNVIDPGVGSRYSVFHILLEARKDTLKHLGLLSSATENLQTEERGKTLMLEGVETLRLGDGFPRRRLNLQGLQNAFAEEVEPSYVKLPNLKAAMGEGLSFNWSLMWNHFEHLKYIYVTTLEHPDPFIRFLSRAPNIHHLRLDLGYGGEQESRQSVLRALSSSTSASEVLLPKLTELDMAKDVVWLVDSS